MICNDGETRAARARRRALRAARVATLSVALAGCSLSHRGVTEPPDSGPNPVVDAAPPPLADASPPPPLDAGPADAGCLTHEDAERSEACCEAQGGYWAGENCSWIIEGPRVPPAMRA